VVVPECRLDARMIVTRRDTSGQFGENGENCLGLLAIACGQASVLRSDLCEGAAARCNFLHTLSRFAVDVITSRVEAFP
jgi:hypothetical protein